MVSRERISHLERIIDAKRQETVVTQERCRKFYGAVNCVVALLGGVCRSDKIWTKIVDTQLYCTPY